MALRKEPERRYASVEPLSDDIERFLDGRPVAAQPATLGYRVRRFVGRNRIAVAAAASFAVLLSAFAVVATRQARQVATERDLVRLERDKAQEGRLEVAADLFRDAHDRYAALVGATHSRSATDEYFRILAYQTWLRREPDSP